jgi:hypothetical protein
LSSTKQARRLPHWLARSDIFAIALGAIMILSMYPVGEYYWATYHISEPDLDFTLFFYGSLIVIFGAIWGVIKKLFFS